MGPWQDRTYLDCTTKTFVAPLNRCRSEHSGVRGGKNLAGSSNSTCVPQHRVASLRSLKLAKSLRTL